MTQNVTQDSQDLQFFNRAYQYRKINDKIFNVVNVTRETTSARTEENQSGD